MSFAHAQAKAPTKTPEKKDANAYCITKEGYRLSDSPASQILRLQETVGNQAVQRLIESDSIQAKLRIGQPNDIHEREADRVSEALVCMPELKLQRQLKQADSIQSKSLPKQVPPLVQKQSKKKTEMLLLVPDFTPAKANIIKRRTVNQIEASTVPPIVCEVLKSPGQPLDADIRASMEAHFSHDFSRVRIHADSIAAESAHAISAQAYTVNRDIVFSNGLYAPATMEGRKLLGHELAHVVQQDRETDCVLESSPRQHQDTGIIRRSLLLTGTDSASASEFLRSHHFPSFSLNSTKGGVIEVMTGSDRRPSTFDPEVLWALVRSGFEHRFSIRELERNLAWRRTVVVSATKLVAKGGGRHPAWGEFGKIGKLEGTRLNPTLWRLLTPIHGTSFDVVMQSKPGVLASEAIEDIWRHPDKYAYECYSSTVFIQYRKLLKQLGTSEFNGRFPRGIRLMFSAKSGPKAIVTDLERRGLKEVDVGGKDRFDELIPGDQVHFRGVNEEGRDTGFGENAIYVGDGKFYAHPHGIGTVDQVAQSWRGLGQFSHLVLNKYRYRWTK